MDNLVEEYASLGNLLVPCLFYGNALFDLQEVFCKDNLSALMVITSSQTFSFPFVPHHGIHHNMVVCPILELLYPSFKMPENIESDIYYSEDTVFVLITDYGVMLVVPKFYGVSDYQNKKIEELVAIMKKISYLERNKFFYIDDGNSYKRIHLSDLENTMDYFHVVNKEGREQNSLLSVPLGLSKEEMKKWITLQIQEKYKVSDTEKRIL